MRLTVFRRLANPPLRHSAKFTDRLEQEISKGKSAFAEIASRRHDHRTAFWPKVPAVLMAASLTMLLPEQGCEFDSATPRAMADLATHSRSAVRWPRESPESARTRSKEPEETLDGEDDHSPSAGDNSSFPELLLAAIRPVSRRRRTSRGVVAMMKTVPHLELQSRMEYRFVCSVHSAVERNLSRHHRSMSFWSCSSFEEETSRG